MYLIEESNPRTGTVVHEAVLPRDTVAVLIDHDGSGGSRTFAVASGQEIPIGDFPQYPEADADGYAGGRGWTGEPSGTELLSDDEVAARWPGLHRKLLHKETVRRLDVDPENPDEDIKCHSWLGDPSCVQPCAPSQGE